MLILSIDCGFRNLSICLIYITNVKLRKKINISIPHEDIPHFTIIYWENIDILDGKKLSNVNSVNLIKYLVKSLDNNTILNTYFSHIDKIIIEDQPRKNMKSKTIQISLYTYFLVKFQQIKPIEIICISPKYKLTAHSKEHKQLISQYFAESKYPKLYNKRKEVAVKLTNYLLKNMDNYSINNDKWLKKFEKEKKQDDLSDCFLQAIGYFNHLFSTPL